MGKKKPLPELLSSNDSFETLFYLSPIGMAISTLIGGTFIEVNEPYCAITGYRRDQLIGKTSAELNMLRSDQREVILETVVRIGFLHNLEANLLTATGAVRVVATSIHHATYNGQECFITTVIDITERKSMEEELRHLAQTDALSGLSNRRHFIHLAEIELTRSIRFSTDMSVLVIDIDHFKQINDTYGHHAGDVVIHEVGRLCKSTFRQIDIVGRVGGEEFAAVLPQCDVSAALIVAERLRMTFASAQIPLDQDVSLPLHITVSMGIATLTHFGATIDSLLANADQALYSAKRSGRNRVCIYNQA